MASELQRVAHGLISALDDVPRVVGFLQDMARRCRNNAAYVGGMSNNPAAQRAALQLDEASSRCEEAAHHLSRTSPRARGWAEQMVSGTGTPEGATGGPPKSRGAPAEGDRRGSQGTPGTSTADDSTGPGDEGRPPAVLERSPLGEAEPFDPSTREVLERLPLRKRGDKTSGIWIDASGNEHDLLSGVDEYTSDVDRLMEDLQIRIAPGADTLGSHVEVKFAMRMRREGLTDETIVINNRPCPGPYGCHRNLWKFLPDGARLTVYGPDNFKRTYPQ
ncbi:DddA-like double-stranded DNA deaminase toxin [Kribbella italica]|uniref:Nucleic acid/nucleotide deaminase of polymorphic system toxin n=1 Tax=Kribbella italica TaxID=1540520 RepID=A0A7W9J7H4_9ACTN|nr:DddA-like double-stranded DNA deaminase toxin [Kribbella italica]MBB5836754.1 hypothetical protein [Kribbella italica]